MTEIGLFEAKNKLSELVERASGGEEIVITRHGKPAARLVATEPAEEEAWRRHREAIEKLTQLRDSGAFGPPMTIEEIIAAKHEGHRY